MGSTGQTRENRRSARTVSTPTGVGVRVRALRISSGLTQAELGGSRFTKEYVSQVELGKTKPSDAALAWFAEALGVDRVTLEGESGVSARAACEAAVARAEAEIEAHRDREALAILADTDTAAERSGDDRLRFRHAQARGWALQAIGQMPEALSALAQAGVLADGLTDTDRAGVLYRVGLVRYKMGSLATAAAALDEAAKLAEGAIEPSDALRVRILNVRAKVRRRQKDFTAAVRGRHPGARAGSLVERRSGAGRDAAGRVAGGRASEPVFAGARLRRAFQGAVRARVRPRVRRQAAEQPRPAAGDHRQAGGGGAAADRVLPDCGRAGQPRRCRFCSLLSGVRQAPHAAITKVPSRVEIARSGYWVLAWNTEKKKGTLES